MCVYIYICVCVYICVFVYVCVYVCMYVCMYVCVYILPSCGFLDSKKAPYNSQQPTTSNQKMTLLLLHTLHITTCAYLYCGGLTIVSIEYFK